MPNWLIRVRISAGVNFEKSGKGPADALFVAGVLTPAGTCPLKTSLYNLINSSSLNPLMVFSGAPEEIRIFLSSSGDILPPRAVLASFRLGALVNLDDSLVLPMLRLEGAATGNPQSWP